MEQVFKVNCSAIQKVGHSTRQLTWFPQEHKEEGAEEEQLDLESLKS